jgi:hypothetical protein
VNEQKQQIEMLANQAIADADTLGKVYATAFHRRLAANIKAIQASSVQQMCQVFSSQLVNEAHQAGGIIDHIGSDRAVAHSGVSASDQQTSGDHRAFPRRHELLDHCQAARHHRTLTCRHKSLHNFHAIGSDRASAAVGGIAIYYRQSSRHYGTLSSGEELFFNLQSGSGNRAFSSTQKSFLNFESASLTFNWLGLTLNNQGRAFLVDIFTHGFAPSVVEWFGNRFFRQMEFTKVFY